MLCCPAFNYCLRRNCCQSAMADMVVSKMSAAGIEHCKMVRFNRFGEQLKQLVVGLCIALNLEN
jgi:hypothetical protein